MTLTELEKRRYTIRCNPHAGMFVVTLPDGTAFLRRATLDLSTGRYLAPHFDETISQEPVATTKVNPGGDLNGGFVSLMLAQ